MRISDWSSDVCSSDLIDAYYRRINDPSGTITLASRLPRVPKWTATLSREFNVFLANEGRVTLRADYSYKSTMAADAETTREWFRGNVSLVNASLTYSAPGDDWSPAIGGNTVFRQRNLPKERTSAEKGKRVEEGRDTGGGRAS